MARAVGKKFKKFCFSAATHMKEWLRLQRKLQLLLHARSANKSLFCRQHGKWHQGIDLAVRWLE